MKYKVRVVIKSELLEKVGADRLLNPDLYRLCWILCSMSNSPICSQVRDLDGEEDRSAGVCAAGGSGGGQAQDGDDGVRLPHGSRNETNLEAPAFIFHSRLLLFMLTYWVPHIIRMRESSIENIKKPFLIQQRSCLFMTGLLLLFSLRMLINTQSVSESDVHDVHGSECANKNIFNLSVCVRFILLDKIFL